MTIDGVQIISGHFDKNIRFWDQRSETSRNEIALQGKITSLDISRDKNYLLACVRDDTLVTIDLRMNHKIVSTFRYLDIHCFVSIPIAAVQESLEMNYNVNVLRSDEGGSSN